MRSVVQTGSVQGYRVCWPCVPLARPVASSFVKVVDLLDCSHAMTCRVRTFGTRCLCWMSHVSLCSV